MHLAALLDLGLDFDDLVLELNGLGLPGYGVQAGRASRQGISGAQVRVVLDPHQPTHRNPRQIEALIGSSALEESVRARTVDVLDRLFAAGASDVWPTPALMKKNRPGTMLGVLRAPALESELIERLLLETTTLG